MSELFATELSKEVKNREVAIVGIPDEKYNDGLIYISKQLVKNYNNICYVSLNKLYDHLAKSLDDNNIDKNKFFFIDAVTKSAMPVKEIKNCIYISSISALTELNIAINKTLESGKFECLLFDSLSTMLIYHDSATVTKFIHTLVTKVRLVNCTAFFTILESGSNTALVKDLYMFIDKKVDLKEAEEKISVEYLQAKGFIKKK